MLTFRVLFLAIMVNSGFFLTGMETYHLSVESIKSLSLTEEQNNLVSNIVSYKAAPHRISFEKINQLRDKIDDSFNDNECLFHKENLHGLLIKIEIEKTTEIISTHDHTLAKSPCNHEPTKSSRKKSNKSVSIQEYCYAINQLADRCQNLTDTKSELLPYCIKKIILCTPHILPLLQNSHYALSSIYDSLKVLMKYNPKFKPYIIDEYNTLVYFIDHYDNQLNQNKRIYLSQDTIDTYRQTYIKFTQLEGTEDRNISDFFREATLCSQLVGGQTRDLELYLRNTFMQTQSMLPLFCLSNSKTIQKLADAQKNIEIWYPNGHCKKRMLLNLLNHANKIYWQVQRQKILIRDQCARALESIKNHSDNANEIHHHLWYLKTMESLKYLQLFDALYKQFQEWKRQHGVS